MGGCRPLGDKLGFTFREVGKDPEKAGRKWSELKMCDVGKGKYKLAIYKPANQPMKFLNSFLPSPQVYTFDPHC